MSSLTEDTISHSALISVGYEILYTFTSSTDKEESSNTWQKKVKALVNECFYTEIYFC